MEIDDEAKEIVREIGSAINESVENSTKVAEAIERLREAGSIRIFIRCNT